MWHKVNFKRNLTGLSSEFSFSEAGCHTKAKEPSLPYYLPIIADDGIVGYIPFLTIFALSEMQTTPSKNRTRFAVSISNVDNHYTTSTSNKINIIIMSCHRHGYHWPSLAISPYCSSPLAGLQGYIPYLLDVCSSWSSYFCPVICEGP